MPPLDHVKAYTLGILIIVLGILGLLILVGLAIAWRNYQRRQRQFEQRRGKDGGSGETLSAWEEAGKRYREPEAGDQDEASERGGQEDDDDRPFKR